MYIYIFSDHIMIITYNQRKKINIHKYCIYSLMIILFLNFTCLNLYMQGLYVNENHSLQARTQDFSWGGVRIITENQGN